MSAAKNPTAKEMREAELQAEEEQKRVHKLSTATATKEMSLPLKIMILCGAASKATGKPRAGDGETKGCPKIYLASLEA